MLDQIAGVVTTDLAWAAAVAAISGLVHGYTGFGGALALVPLLALLYGPVEAVAVTQIVALIGSATAYSGAARLVRWREVGPLSVAIVVFTPMGVAVLLVADPDWIRRAIGLFVLAAALLILSGWVYRGARGPLAGAVTGALCGAISGAAGVGGPPVAVYFLAAPEPPEVQRANILVSVGVVIVVAISSIAIGGGIGTATLVRSAVLAPLYLAGFRAGVHLFHVAPSELYRKAAIALLIATGISAIAL